MLGLVCVVSLYAPYESHECAAAARSSSVASVGLLFALTSVFWLSAVRLGASATGPPPPRRISSNDLSQAVAPAMKQVPPDLSRLKIKIPQ